MANSSNSGNLWSSIGNFVGSLGSAAISAAGTGKSQTRQYYFQKLLQEQAGKTS